MLWRTHHAKPDPKSMRVMPLCFWVVQTRPDYGAHCPFAAQRGHGALFPPRFSAPPQPNGKQRHSGGPQLRVVSFGVDSRFETDRSSSTFNVFGLHSKLISKVQIDSKGVSGSVGAAHYQPLPLSILKSEPRRNPSFFKCILRFRGPRKKIKAQPGGEAASPPACAIGAFIGLHGQKCI